eukprot:CAMPEP_0197393246 /NCGR_PEP_ID=MMETSP1165-20131217/4209_1 /TAXON_ID=284809 /ORGANISM="Chrysocystis fragilis, Strain CCMP3189" /LENGTH=71 /DNA_ID=CAMNT_0042918907 /DNA_START=28 /DNA_END=243 /DNA_ORIENTATION=-
MSATSGEPPLPLSDSFEEEGEEESQSVFCFFSCTGLFEKREPEPGAEPEVKDLRDNTPRDQAKPGNKFYFF